MDAAVLGDRLPEVTQKPFLGPKSLSLQCRHWESSKVLAGLALCEMPSQYQKVCFLGTLGGSPEGSAAVRDPNPPRPFARYRVTKRPVLLRANFVLTKDWKRPYYGHFCGKMHSEGSFSKVAGGSLVKSRCWILSWGWGFFCLLLIPVEHQHFPNKACSPGTKALSLCDFPFFRVFVVCGPQGFYNRFRFKLHLVILLKLP